MTTRTLVLDEDGLDVLELALAGALPGLPLPADAAGRRGRPGAHRRREHAPRPACRRRVRARARWRPCSRFARHGGPHWDPELRLTPGAPASAWRPWPPAGRSSRLVIDDVPTRADLDRRGRRRATAPARGPCWSRSRCRGGPVRRATVGWAGLTRAALAAAEALRARPARHRRRARRDPVARGRRRSLARAGPRGGRAGLRRGRCRCASPGCAAPPSETASRRSRASTRRPCAPCTRRRPRSRCSGPAAAAPRRGAVVLFTGLSGSGKSTIARGPRRGPRRRRVPRRDAARRRRGPPASLGGAGLRRGLARAQRGAHRLGGGAGRPPRRHRGRGTHRPVRRLAGPRPRDGRAARPVPARLGQHAARGLRGPRPQGALRAGPGGRGRGLHGDLVALRGARATPTS